MQPFQLKNIPVEVGVKPEHMGSPGAELQGYSLKWAGDPMQAAGGALKS